MYPTGHYGVSLLAFAPILALCFLFNQPVLGLIGLGIVLFLATFPDKDLNYWFLKHRGPTHTLWFAALVGGVSAIPFALYPADAFGLGHVGQTFIGWFFGFFGILGHILGDILTPSGVRPLTPFSDRRFSLYITTAKGVWWFETIKSGNQERMTYWERIRHAILNSNRILLVLGLIATGVASLPYVSQV